MKAQAVIGLLLLGLTAAPGTAPEQGRAFDSWLYNPRERTSTGLRLLDKGKPWAALEALDVARRLSPEEPLPHFNAGTVRLLLGDPEATAVLEQAVALSEASLASWAYYNLGNARLAAGDAYGAVSAYEETLRRDPGHQAAKFNLELALQELEPPAAISTPPQDSLLPDGMEQPDGDGRGDEHDAPVPSPGAGEAGEAGPLPDFADQPELTAQQAAAILDAVERLEQRQRRAEAERMRGSWRGDKDW